MSRTVVFRKAAALEGRGGFDGPFSEDMAAGAWGGNSKGHMRAAP